MPYYLSPLTAFYTLLLAACIYDMRERRVPQWVNGILLGGGFLYQSYIYGFEGLVFALLGALMTLALLIVPFALYVYKGGDVKLCLGVGAWLGWEEALWFVAYGIVLGGILGVIFLGINHLKNKTKDKTKIQSEFPKNELPQTVPMAIAFSLSALYLTWGGF